MRFRSKQRAIWGPPAIAVAFGLGASSTGCTQVIDVDDLRGDPGFADADAGLQDAGDEEAAPFDADVSDTSDASDAADTHDSSEQDAREDAPKACTETDLNCDGDALNGCETDTLSDPLHCGSCGHDCLGGACEDGGCHPVQIAGGQSNPFGITVEATTGRVYWTNSTSGEVASVGLDGSGYELHASGQATPQSVRYHDGYLYWANAGEAATGRIMKLDLSNSLALPEVFVDDQKNPMDLAFAFSRLYWTNNTADGAVMSVPMAGGSPEVVLGNLNRPGAIIADDSAVYAAVVLGRRLVGIGPSDELQMDQQLDDMPAGLATDLLDVYWTTLSGNVRKRSKLPNSPVLDVATSSGLLTGIVLDSVHVYFADTSQGIIYRVAKVGGSKTPVALGQQSPFNMAGDADSVYWSNRVASGGSIMRLAK